MNAIIVTDTIKKTNTLPENAFKLQKPKKFKVILLNDDYTPMEFVVLVLQRFFHHSESVASDIMLQIHIKGSGICGIFTKDIAETKVAQVNSFSRQHDHPLLCCMEPV